MNKLTAGKRTSARPYRTRRLTAGVASAAALALAALTSTTAHAAQAADCPSGALCLYSVQGFGGERLTLSSLTTSGACISLVDHGWAGRVESAANTHTASAALFPNDDCLGSPYRVDAGASVADLGAFVPLSAWVPGRTN
ncbi:peptidase inhibitor family I36 protein [Streptomyces sp. NPDC059224]|uniref:peptidase inhibitor family I36 protein n=1 Tax=Streptomyces sp. NPDC059224 TaxID=3346775 RepID=UPI0036C90121